jgi:hypothetical protein
MKIMVLGSHFILARSIPRPAPRRRRPRRRAPRRRRGCRHRQARRGLRGPTRSFQVKSTLHFF